MTTDKCHSIILSDNFAYQSNFLQQSTKINVMDFGANDPGCVKYGNFINYYSFNSAKHRIQLLPKKFWDEATDSCSEISPYYIALDIGCNSGELTQLLYEFLSENIPNKRNKIFILGIDLDPVLVERAKESNKYPERVSYECVDILIDKESILDQYLSTHGVDKFNTVFSFSLTMWIHLNSGDEGLKTFLEKCTKISKLFVIEPQPWKCYQTAVKRLKKSNQVFPQFPFLKWRSNVETNIEAYLENDLGQQKLYETEPTKWKRKICFYVDNIGPIASKTL